MLHVNGINEAEKLVVSNQETLPEEGLTNPTLGDCSTENQSIANIANVASNQEEQVENVEFIPNLVYRDLPKLLRDSSNLFSDRRERDIYLTGAISVLGGCFHNLYAYNAVDKKSVAPNLMMFIVAPPASGKGVLKYSKRLASDISETFREKSKSSKGKHLIVPGNISSAGLMQILMENKGIGLMVESEIDTIVAANKQDWGNFSDILRQAFENETASSYRKKDKEHLEIPNVKLSIAVSGTLNQFKSLIPSVENGLFSRGCYYNFENEAEELKCYGRLKTTKDINEHFKEYSKTADDYYKLLRKHGNVNVVFSEKQLEIIQNSIQFAYDSLLTETAFHANLKRLFVSIMKIATILTFLRACENNSVQQSIDCAEIDLMNSIKLATVYLAHSFRMLYHLPSCGNSELTLNQQKLLDEMPAEFTRADAVAQAGKIGVSVKTIDNFLKLFKDKGKVEAIKAGQFKKTSVKN